MRRGKREGRRREEEEEEQGMEQEEQIKKRGEGGEKRSRVLKSTKETLLSHIRKLWHEVKQVLCEYFLGNMSLSEVLNLVRLSRHRVALQVPPEDRIHLIIQIMLEVGGIGGSCFRIMGSRQTCYKIRKTNITPL